MEKEEKLKKLNQKAQKADLPLNEGATNLVFGVGNPNADILFLGEGPGYWEDMKAEPFVGNAGALLNQMLMAINLKREDVYISNVVMYRPPQNRDPENSEIAAFQPYVDGIIEIIRPKIIVTLGRFSMGKFLPGVFISSIHGKKQKVTFKGEEITIYPMYHPAAALRNGEVREKFKNDFLDLPKILEEIIKNPSDKMEEKEEKKIEQMELI